MKTSHFSKSLAARPAWLVSSALFITAAAHAQVSGANTFEPKAPEADSSGLAEIGDPEVAYGEERPAQFGKVKRVNPEVAYGEERPAQVPPGLSKKDLPEKAKSKMLRLPYGPETDVAPPVADTPEKAMPAMPYGGGYAYEKTSPEQIEVKPAPTPE